MMIGKCFEITYYDQNERFAEHLPKKGVIERQLNTESVDNWFLLKLEDPFQYDDQLNTHFLIRSKWVGEEIGTPDLAAVFILLIPTDALLEPEFIDVIKFNHVAWGFAQPCGT